MYLFHGMIILMSRDSILLLLFGFFLGFSTTYFLVRDRDLGPIIVRDSVDPTRRTGASDATLRMREQVEKQLVRDPTNFEALVQMGSLSFDSENFEDAVEYYSRALSVNPDNVNVSTDLGTALYYLNRIDDAFAAFERSLSIVPDHPQSLFNMGVLLIEKRNDKEGAVSLWERLVKGNPDYPQVEMVKEEIARLKQEL